MKKLLRILTLTLGLFAGSHVHAGIPVIDAANLANAIQQLAAWQQQYTQMIQQLNQAQQTYNSLNGMRGMASLVNDPVLRTYLPGTWNQSLNLIDTPGPYTGLSASIKAIRNAAQLLDPADLGLDPDSDAARAFVYSQNQAATNRGMAEAAYKASSDRISAIQTLLDKVDDAPEQKDILDLQARIQAEQVMVQNETAKLQIMAQLQQAQRDIQAQQAREIGIKATKSSPIPRF